MLLLHRLQHRTDYITYSWLVIFNSHTKCHTSPKIWNMLNSIERDTWWGVVFQMWKKYRSQSPLFIGLRAQRCFCEYGDCTHVTPASTLTCAALQRTCLHATPACDLLLTVGAVVDGVLTAVNAERDETTSQVTPAENMHQFKPARHMFVSVCACVCSFVRVCLCISVWVSMKYMFI